MMSIQIPELILAVYASDSQAGYSAQEKQWTVQSMKEKKAKYYTGLSTKSIRVDRNKGKRNKISSEWFLSKPIIKLSISGSINVGMNRKQNMIKKNRIWDKYVDTFYDYT